ncbi:hypothetical protein [Rhodococcus triatomae]
MGRVEGNGDAAQGGRVVEGASAVGLIRAIGARVKYLNRRGVSVVWVLTVDRQHTTVIDRVTPDITADAIATALEQGLRR